MKELRDLKFLTSDAPEYRTLKNLVWVSDLVSALTHSMHCVEGEAGPCLPCRLLEP